MSDATGVPPPRRATVDRRLKSKNKRRKRSRLLLEFGPFCHLCGRLILRSDLTVDHVRPIGRGGSNAIDNLALAHGECNHAKGHHTLARALLTPTDTGEAVLGSIVTVSVVVKVGGVATDPTTIKLEVANPDGSVTTFASPTHDSTGNYHVDVTPALTGRSSYKWTGTGTAAGTAEAGFDVVDTFLTGATDLLTLPEAKAAIFSTSNPSSVADTHDVELAGFVTAVSRRFDALCGPIVKRTITAEAHNGGVGFGFGGSPGVGYGASSYEGFTGGPNFIRLLKRPVVSVTTVVEWGGGTSANLILETPSAAGDYLLDAAEGVLYRRAGFGDTNWMAGRQNVVVTYVAGRYDSPTLVDQHFKTAARITLQHLWRPSAGAWAQSGDRYPDAELPAAGGAIPPWAVPRAALMLVADELLGPGMA